MTYPQPQQQYHLEGRLCRTLNIIIIKINNYAEREKELHMQHFLFIFCDRENLAKKKTQPKE